MAISRFTKVQKKSRRIASLDDNELCKNNNETKIKNLKMCVTHKEFVLFQSDKSNAKKSGGLMGDLYELTCLTTYRDTHLSDR